MEFFPVFESMMMITLFRWNWSFVFLLEICHIILRQKLILHFSLTLTKFFMLMVLSMMSPFFMTFMMFSLVFPELHSLFFSHIIETTSTMAFFMVFATPLSFLRLLLFFHGWLLLFPSLWLLLFLCL